MLRLFRFSGLIAAIGAISFLLSSTLAADKIKIEKLDDLPRHIYKIDVKAVELLSNSAAAMKLAGEVKKDLEDDLAKFDIQDKTTLKDYYANLGTISLLEGKYDVYLDLWQKRQELEDKEASKLTMGMPVRAYIAAKKSGAKDDAFKAAFRAELQKIVTPLPFDVVQDNIKQSKGSFEIMNRTLMEGSIEASVQQTLDKSNGEMSKDIALGLIGQYFTVNTLLPLKEEIVAVYTAYLDAHQQAKKPDIWAERDFALTEKDGKEPVVIAIWDSGTDADIFAPKKQMWVNMKEVAGNNLDDDNNGFVDDVHGIAYDLHSNKEASLLFPIGDVGKERPMLQRRMKGLEDISSNIDSPEATELKKLLSSIPKDSVKPMWEGIGKYGNYCHGTHVGGIAARGNPFIRLLSARMTFDYRMIPETPTIEQAKKDARMQEETIAYFKQHGVRVVNMSWGNSLASVEAALEANNAGGTPEERKKLAREIFEITRVSLFEAIKNAPEILFVTSAGNANNDVKFEEFYPSSFELPNLLTVGAVDQAGEETNFTSFGKVDVYANGFEVVSYVPGGDEMALSGTSMSSPNVVNLAAKLLAKDPKLTTAQLRDAIIAGTDEQVSGDRKVRLINPKKSLELIAAK